MSKVDVFGTPLMFSENSFITGDCQGWELLISVVDFSHVILSFPANFSFDSTHLPCVQNSLVNREIIFGMSNIRCLV